MGIILTGDFCALTHLCQVDFYLNSLDRSTSYTRGVWLVFIIIIVEISELIANSVDPDQTPRSAASGLGLHCLPMSLLCDARCKWVQHLSETRLVPGALDRICMFANFCH